MKSLWVSKVKAKQQPSSIQTLDSLPTPIHFLREYVNLSVPVIIKNAFPIVTLDELVTSVAVDDNDDDDNNDDQNNEEHALNLNVDVTPDGHGDTIRIVDGEKMFVMPEVRNMSFTNFRDRLRKNDKKGLQRRRQR